MDWTPPPPAALIAALEAGWRPARARRLGGWLVRGGAGAGRRATSIWPMGDPGLPLEAAIDAAAAIQAGWGLRPRAQLGPEDGALDAALAARGWTVDEPCRVLAAPADRVAALGLGGRMAVVVRCPLACLDELWEAGGIGPARRAVMEATPGPKDCILIREDDRPAGAVFVAAPGPIATLHALFVAPPFRGRGLGLALCAAAAEAALAAGARTLALAVSDANAPARAIYARACIPEVFGYRYREDPTETRP